MTHHYHNHCHSMSSSPATLTLSVSHNSHYCTVYRLITVLFSSVQLNQFRRISSSIAGKHAVSALWSSWCACPPSDPHRHWTHVQCTPVMLELKSDRGRSWTVVDSRVVGSLLFNFLVPYGEKKTHIEFHVIWGAFTTVTWALFLLHSRH